MASRKSTEERQGEIADAALRIIGTRGISALTVAALAKELGLTGGALYRHFDSSEAILRAVAARAVELLSASLPDPALPPLERLERFVHTRSRTVSGHVGLARLIFSDQLAMALPEDAMELLRGAVRTTGAGIGQALAEAQAQGEVRTDVEVEDLVTVVMGTVQFLAVQRVGMGTGMGMARAVNPTRVWSTLRILLAPVAGGAR